MKKAVFLDRDGTLNVDKGYVYRTEDMEWIPGVPEALKRLKDAGYLLIVVTNQSGVARGYYTEDDVRALHAYMNQYLRDRYGFCLDAFYYCPHHPEAAIPAYRKRCGCRKPAPGLVLRAVRDFDIHIASSYMIGDSESDRIRLEGLRFYRVTGAAPFPDIAAEILRPERTRSCHPGVCE